MQDRFHPLRDVWLDRRYTSLRDMPSYVLIRNVESLRDWLHENPSKLRRLADADRYLDCFNGWKGELERRKEAVPSLNPT